MVSKHGSDNHELHQQGEWTKQRKEERCCGRKTIGIDGIPSNRWLFLTPRLENATNKTREDAPLLIKQIWEFLQGQLEVAESRDMTVGRFVTAANEVSVEGFWSEYAKAI